LNREVWIRDKNGCVTRDLDYRVSQATSILGRRAAIRF
jgi:hypothetical protein